MNTQPEALYLADNADKIGAHRVAAELRRLHEKNRFLVTQLGLAHDGKHRLQDLNAELLEKLQSSLSEAKPVSVREYWRDSTDGESSELVREETWPDWVVKARAAIAKATGEQV